MGWNLIESGSAANTSYAADAGSNTAGNTYSYGTGTNTERALGMLRSNALTPIIGLQVKNTSGKTLTTLNITYFGEQWRCGNTNRPDQLDFQYSLNATSLSSGSWVDVNTLDFSSPYTSIVGARDGNATGNRSQRSAVISGLAIPNNALFWIRWIDMDAAGADDGLSIDDFSLSAGVGDNTAPTVTLLEPANGALNISLAGTLRMTFSESVQKGAGQIYLKKASDGSVVASWLVGDASVSINTNVVTIPYTGLSNGITYYVEMPSGVFKDASNNNYIGLSGSTAWRFNTLPPPDTLKVVNWNIEWFGGSLGPANDSLQEENVRKVMQNVNADLYGLAEVVSTDRLKNIVSKMPGYDFMVGSFCSNYTNCTNAQKLGFVYRTSVIKPIRTYAVLQQGGSDSAYYNWSSGRYPYLLEADVSSNGVTQRVQFIMIHAKANTSDYVVSYQRRKAGAKELHDSLTVQYPSANWIVMGDYNDDLDKTITTQIAPDTTTSFISFINDTSFKPVTLPLSKAGQPSTASYKDMIDHVTISNDMNRFYVSNSAKILKEEVMGWIPDYSTTTSDHYPVLTRFILKDALPLVTPSIVMAKAQSPDNIEVRWIILNDEIRVYANAGNNDLLQVYLYNINGQLISGNSGISMISLPTTKTIPGVYILQVRSGKAVSSKKIFLQ